MFFLFLPQEENILIKYFQNLCYNKKRNEEYKMNITERFLKYVSFDTQSDENSHSVPSSSKQLKLAHYLVEELQQLSIQNAFVNEYGIVYAFIEANNGSNQSIGLIAHMDTSPDMSGKNVKPRIISDYDGSPIVLNQNLQIIMNPEVFVDLKKCLHQDLIVTDGTTLLGADDKAGIAIIMDFVEYLVSHPEYLHCKICIAFTPDEEIGKGTDHFDVAFFNADFAYTIDGGSIHEINYENFNAASAEVSIYGNSIHPGSAKGKMKNSILIAQEFNALLPQDAIPSKTEGYEGFHHLCDIQGNCEKTILNYILRDHDLNLLTKQKQYFIKAAEILNQKYGKETIKLEISDSYYNMKEVILKNPLVLSKVYHAYEKLNLFYEIVPIRGGTDGARLSYEELLTPNLGTGGFYCHGKFEFVSINQMQLMVQILKEIVS